MSNYALVGSAGTPNLTTSAGTNSPAYGQAPTAKSLLIAQVACAVISNVACNDGSWSAIPSADTTQAEAQVYYKVAVGGDAAPTFAVTAAARCTVQLTEWAVPGNTGHTLDKDGTLLGTVSPSVLACSGTDAGPNRLVIGAFSLHLSAAATASFGLSAGYSDLFDDGLTSASSHALFVYSTTVTTGGSADSVTATTTGGTVNHVAGCIASFFATAPLAVAAAGGSVVSGTAGITEHPMKFAATGGAKVFGSAAFATASPPPPPDTLGQTPFWYSPQQILPVLLGPTVQESWKFVWVDANGADVQDITSYVEACTVSHDSTRAVMRQCTMTLKGGVQVNFSTDFIQVFYRLRMPAGDWVDFPLGMFVFDIPTKTIAPARNTFAASGNDPSYYLVEDSFTDAFSVPAGVAAIPIVRSLANDIVFGTDIFDSHATLSTSLSWDVGDTKLQAINDLLSAIAYENFWCDSNGIGRARPLIDYTLETPLVTFDTTNQKINVVTDDITEAPDRSGAYNQIVVEVSPAGATSFSVVYINNNPDSPVSTVNWHPRTVVVQNSTLADIPSAETYAQSLAQQYARVFTIVTLVTWPWPLSENLDLYGVVWDTEDEGLVSFNYVETAWEHVCGTGQATTHTLQRVVPV